MENEELRQANQRFTDLSQCPRKHICMLELIKPLQAYRVLWFISQK